MKKQLLGLIVLVVFFSVIIPNAFAASHQIYNYGSYGLNINIDSGYYASYANIGSVAYTTVGCTWYAGARVSELTNQWTSYWDGPSWWSTKYKEFSGFFQSSTLNTAYKSIACWNNHVGIVEGFTTGGKIIFSEGGVSHLSYVTSNHGYCMITTFADEATMKRESTSTFLGYIVFPVAAINGQDPGDMYKIDFVRDTEHWSIGETNAVVGAIGSGTMIRSVSKVWGEIYNAAGTKVAQSTPETPRVNSTDGKIHMWFNVNDEMGYTLQRGTYYSCRLVMQYPDGSEQYTWDSFTTGGIVYVSSIEMDRSLELYPGDSSGINAIALPTNANNRSITFTSSDTSVATVDNSGIVTAVSVGTCLVRATAVDGSGVMNQCEVRVSERPWKISRVDINAGNRTVGSQDSFTVITENVTGEYGYEVSIVLNETDLIGYEFFSTPEFVYTYPERGTYSFAFTVRSNDGEKSATKITEEIQVRQQVTEINPDQTELTVKVEQTAQLNVTVLPENADNQQIIWNSSDPDVAIVDNNGQVLGVGTGNCVITASAADGNGAETAVNVTVQPGEFTIYSIETDATAETSDVGKTVNFTIAYTKNGAQNVDVRMRVLKDGTVIDGSGWQRNATRFSYTFQSHGEHTFQFDMQDVAGIQTTTATADTVIQVRPRPESIQLTVDMPWTLNVYQYYLLPEVLVLPQEACQDVVWELVEGTDSAEYIEGGAIYTKKETSSCMMTCRSALDPNVFVNLQIEIVPQRDIMTWDGFSLESNLDTTVGSTVTYIGVINGSNMDDCSYRLVLTDAEGQEPALAETGWLDKGDESGLTYTFESMGTYLIQMYVRTQGENEWLVSSNIEVYAPEMFYQTDELLLSTGHGLNSIYLGDCIFRGDFFGMAQEKGITWTISDSSVATIDRNGYIRARKTGSAIVTAHYYDATCTLKVRVVNSMNVLVIPDGTKTIEAEAFSGDSKIQMIYLPDTVMSIGNSAFAGMSGLRYIIFDSDNVTAYIAENAFPNSSSIQAYWAENDQYDHWKEYIEQHSPAWSAMTTGTWTK